MKMADNIAEALAEFVYNLKPDMIQPPIANRVKAYILDWIGVTIQGAQTEIGHILAETLLEKKDRIPFCFQGNPAIFADPWLSASRSLGIWLFLAFFFSIYWKQDSCKKRYEL